MANFNLPSSHPSQPRLVQLAAILTNDVGEEISTINLLVKPEGFCISEGAAKIHGISTDHATQFGIPARAAIGIFVHMARTAETLHAYNIKFDTIVMEGEILRIDKMPNPFSDKPRICEMEAMTQICKIPGTRGGYKWPSLTESHIQATGKEFANAHDALGDVRAMIAVHIWRANQKNTETNLL